MEKIDIVYTWVNGEDPNWELKRKKYREGAPLFLDAYTAQDGNLRYIEQDELKISIRSLVSFAPWVNHIYIVTDQQVPSWLHVGNEVTIVDHKDIIPEKYLPTFNSSVIEAFLHNIEGLSEHFIYFNDDVFLCRTVSPEDFFYKGKPKIFTSSIFPRRRKNKLVWGYNQLCIARSREIVQKRLGCKVNYGLRHGVRPMLKSRLKVVAVLFEKNYESYLKNRFRYEPFSVLYLYAFYEIAKKNAKPQYMRIFKNKRNYFNFPSLAMIRSEDVDVFFEQDHMSKCTVGCFYNIDTPLLENVFIRNCMPSQANLFEKEVDTNIKLP